MRLKTLLLLALLPSLALAAVTVTPAPADPAKIAELKKTYPTDTCPVSGDKIGGMMGDPLDRLYVVKDADGKETTRLVRFCCGACPKKFEKAPDGYLKALDDATAKKK